MATVTALKADSAVKSLAIDGDGHLIATMGDGTTNDIGSVGSGGGGGGGGDGTISIRHVTGASVTLAPSDVGTMIVCSRDAGDFIVEINTHDAAAIPLGACIAINQGDSSRCIVDSVPGVTLLITNDAVTAATRAHNSVIILTQQALDYWLVSGDFVEVVF